MKRRLLGIGIIALSLQLAACGGAPGGDGKENNGSVADSRETEIQRLIDSLENGDTEGFVELYNMREQCQGNHEWEGTWNRTNVHSGHSAEIVVSKADEDGFWFSVEAYYYSHSGSWDDGRAYFVTDSFAVAEYVSDILDEKQYAAFLLTDEGMTVKATGSSAELGFGMNVSVWGDYTKGEPVYTNAGILEELFTDEDLKVIKDMLPAAYYEDYFLFATENGVVNETEGEDGGRTIEVFVPTMGGYGYTLRISKTGEYSVEFQNGTVF